MNSNIGRLEVVLASLLIAVGLALGGYFVSQTLYNAKVGINMAEVKGLAERRVEADRAFWKIQYTVTGNGTTHRASSTTAREFRDENQKLVEEKHVLVGSIDVETNKVRLVSQVRAKLNQLIAQGPNITNNPPAYYFTKLNTIKPAMVKEATTNARLAANEFAADAGVEVGRIRDAQQGGFIVHDVGEEYGDTKTIEKEVRLVTTIAFYLTE